jgi:predicted nucleic acid-binding protein
VKVILDTGPLVALMSKTDRWHAWAVDTLKALKPPLITCEAVLVEAAHLTGRPADVIAQLAAGAFTLGLSAAEQAQALERLLRRYAGRMDLADACVVRLSELRPAAKVLTLDVKDFSIYRRNGREAIPLIAPQS